MISNKGFCFSGGDQLSRKHLTEVFPWLWPLRKKQRTSLFYLMMHLDHNRYSTTQKKETLPYLVYRSSYPLRNMDTGFDMLYQENKIHNLKLAAAKLDGLVIEPGESFSFWKCVKNADREEPYKDALSDIDGEIVPSYGGGLSALSNLLCWLFLHTPVTIIERHGHRKRAFPEPPGEVLPGTDATVQEGWLDFRITNYTYYSFQLSITFDEDNIIGAIYAECDPIYTWNIVNHNLIYYKENGSVFEAVDVVRQLINENGFLVSETTLYQNTCEIGYRLPDDINVLKKGKPHE